MPVALARCYRGRASLQSGALAFASAVHRRGMGRDGVAMPDRRIRPCAEAELARRPLCRREHHSVVGPAVTVGEHAADRTIALHVHTHGVAVPQLVANVKVDAFAHDELALAVDIDGFPDLA